MNCRQEGRGKRVFHNSSRYALLLLPGNFTSLFGLPGIDRCLPSSPTGLINVSCAFLKRRRRQIADCLGNLGTWFPTLGEGFSTFSR